MPTLFDLIQAQVLQMLLQSMIAQPEQRREAQPSSTGARLDIPPFRAEPSPSPGTRRGPSQPSAMGSEGQSNRFLTSPTGPSTGGPSVDRNGNRQGTGGPNVRGPNKEPSFDIKVPHQTPGGTFLNNMRR